VSNTAKLGPPAKRQLLDPATHTDPRLAGTAALVDRALARAAARQAVHVGRRAEDDQVDVEQRGQRVVDREDSDVALGREDVRDLLRDPLRVPEPGLI